LAYRRSLLPAIGAVTLLAIPVPSRADTANPLAELVDAAAGRLQVADDVAAVKWRTGGAIEDPVRVQQQLAQLADDAARNDLDPAYVQRIFGDQIAATEAVEHHRFAQWKLDPATAPASAPELAASRARIDGFNREMLTQIGLRRQQLHSPECAALLDEAVREVSAARRLGEFEHGALTSATREYCSE